MHRGYRWTDKDHIKEPSRPVSLPSNMEHGGTCKSCGAFTLRNVTVGGPGHPRNGWECQGCGDHYMALELIGVDMSKL